MDRYHDPTAARCDWRPVQIYSDVSDKHPIRDDFDDGGSIRASVVGCRYTKPKCPYRSRSGSFAPSIVSLPPRVTKTIPGTKSTLQPSIYSVTYCRITLADAPKPNIFSVCPKKYFYFKALDQIQFARAYALQRILCSVYNYYSRKVVPDLRKSDVGIWTAEL